MIDEKTFHSFRTEIFKRLDKLEEKNSEEHGELNDRLTPIEAEFKERENINRLGMRIGNGLIFISKVILALGVIYGVVSGTFAGWMGR